MGWATSDKHIPHFGNRSQCPNGCVVLEGTDHFRNGFQGNQRANPLLGRLSLTRSPKGNPEVSSPLGFRLADKLPTITIALNRIRVPSYPSTRTQKSTRGSFSWRGHPAFWGATHVKTKPRTTIPSAGASPVHHAGKTPRLPIPKRLAALSGSSQSRNLGVPLKGDHQQGMEFLFVRGANLHFGKFPGHGKTGPFLFGLSRLPPGDGKILRPRPWPCHSSSSLRDVPW